MNDMPNDNDEELAALFESGGIRASDLPEPTPEESKQVEELEKQLELLRRRANKLLPTWGATPVANRIQASKNFQVELTPSSKLILDDLLAHSEMGENGFSDEVFVNRLLADVRALLIYGTQSSWLLGLRMARLGLLQEKPLDETAEV